MKKRRTVKIEIPENLAYYVLEQLEPIMDEVRVLYASNTALIGDLEEDFGVEVEAEKNEC